MRWEFLLTGLGRPPTANWLAASHWTKTGRAISAWRKAARECAERSYPGFVVECPVVVLGQALLSRQGRHQDPAACYPAVKAAVDGLVDAGFLKEDDGRHVSAVVLLPPATRAGVNGLYLWLTTNEPDYLPDRYLKDLALSLS